MLKRFEVENFKGFKSRMVFDLSARDYEFNKFIVRDKIVNKAIIYGKNGVGKSSLGIALFDITAHLTDKERMNTFYIRNYKNLNALDKPVTFVYVFQFDETEIVYEYEKSDLDELLSEKIWINNQLQLKYNYFDSSDNYVADELKGSLNIDLSDNKLSVIKYIYRNTPTNPSSVITKLVQFCEGMLWYRSLSEGNCYSGFTNGGANMIEKLYESKKLEEFQVFLQENGLDYTLKFEVVNDRHELLAVYNDGKNSAPFASVASTGTMALFLFFIWKITAFDKISLLFIDEFDAFLHYESAENIVRMLNGCRNFQSVVTTHNTYLMKNELTRPDCCYIITKDKITNLYNATDREIREAHNLEKMYINGVFTE